MEQPSISRKLALFRIQAVVAEVRKREDPQYDCPPEERQLFSAIKGLLKAHVRSDPFDMHDLEQLREAQNLPILRYGREMLETPYGKVQLLNPVMDLRRIVAEGLVGYFDCFIRAPRLLKFKPIGLCARAGCDSLFVKKRSDQDFCSGKCREKAWRNEKQREDPLFFAKKAKRQRKHRTPEDMRRKVLEICKRMGGPPKTRRECEEVRDRLISAGFRRAKKLELNAIREMCLRTSGRGRI